MITSLSNPKIKLIRKLRNKKFRDEYQLFYIEGTRIISEAFYENWRFEKVIYCEDLLNDDYSKQLLKKILNAGFESFEVNKQVFESFSIKSGPKGLAALLHPFIYNIEYVKEKSGLWVGLDRIQDPGNLGSIMRTIDSIGGSGVILIDQCTDPFDITAIRGSMGAIFSLKIIKTDHSSFSSLLTGKRIPIVGTSDRADNDYQTVSYNKDMVLLMGSEREGLSDSLVKDCETLVRIPMVGKSDSLNLAVATSVCLYEIFNQNRKNESTQ
jgi:TrmH family RNA methyltransferase